MPARKAQKSSTTANPVVAPKVKGGATSKAESQRSDDLLTTDVLREVARVIAKAANARNTETLRLCANVLHYVHAAVFLEHTKALDAADRTLGRFFKGAPFLTGEAKVGAKEALLDVVAGAIAAYNPGPRARAIAHADEWAPEGFENFSPARKMAIFIALAGFGQRGSWAGVLPVLPRDAVDRMEQVIQHDLDQALITGPDYARTLCMGLLRALGLGKVERDAFVGFLKQRKHRAKVDRAHK